MAQIQVLEMDFIRYLLNLNNDQGKNRKLHALLIEKYKIKPNTYKLKIN